jgi:hypothetical protein
MANGTAPTYDKIGPVTYDITTTKTINSYDKTAGTLTYNSVKTFECAADSEVSCDTDVTQLNIAFQTQVIGATGMAINGIMDATKAGFAAGAIGNEMESFSAGKATADGLATSYGGIQMGAMTGGAMMEAGTASMMIGVGWYDAYDAYFASINGSQMNNLSGGGETITYTQAIQGLQAGEAACVTFAGNASIGNLSYAFESAAMPTGEDASLTSMQGVLLLAGHCDAYPTGNYSTVGADALNAPAFTTGTMQRAGIWGYASADINATIATDYAVCFGVGGTFANIHGGADGDWYEDPNAVNASTRMMNYLGVDIDNTVAMNLLFGGQGTDAPTGLLATNAAGTSFGIANFVQMEAEAAKTAYSLNATQHAAAYGWAMGWLGSVSELPMILLGGTGTMTAEQFVNTTFGAADPINGGYLNNSLNLGGAWAALGASGGNAVDLDPALSGNALYGPLGLTTSTGSAIFLYGELSGFTPPLNFSTNPPTPAPPMAWDANTIAALYGVDTNAANAMRALMMGPIYGTTSESFVPGFLMSSFGATPYLTQSFNSWLLGWHDPVSAFLATGNPMDMSAGWASLETNATYYGSAGIANGDGTNYTMCTGESDTCDKGETLLEDGSAQLSWRNDAMFAATYGLIAPESLANTTGGFLTGTGDLVDVNGYAIAEVTCDGTGTVKNIPVDICSASVNPTKRSIQANLLETYSLLDATPGALPVYFGSDITMEAEQLSGLIIAGDSTSTFYLDTRAHTNLASEPSMSDLVPVFQIESSSMIGTSDAETMESSIVTNQDSMAYWTNFDHPIDYLTLLFWIGGIALIAIGMISAANAPDEDEEEVKDHESAMEETPSEDASEEVAEETSE